MAIEKKPLTYLLQALEGLVDTLGIDTDELNPVEECGESGIQACDCDSSGCRKCQQSAGDEDVSVAEFNRRQLATHLQ